MLKYLRILFVLLVFTPAAKSLAEVGDCCFGKFVGDVCKHCVLPFCDAVCDGTQKVCERGKKIANFAQRKPCQFATIACTGFVGSSMAALTYLANKPEFFLYLCDHGLVKEKILACDSVGAKDCSLRQDEISCKCFSDYRKVACLTGSTIERLASGRECFVDGSLYRVVDSESATMSMWRRH